MLPYLLPQLFCETFGMMCLPPTRCVFLLAFLLAVSKAIPPLQTLPTSTLNISDGGTSFLNSSLAAVIPTFFKIIPNHPLDEPILIERYALALTIHALEGLALGDFDEEQHSMTWRTAHQVAIDVVGPARTVESALAMRKYAIWGIYKAVHLMVASGDYRCRNYELYWRGALVGFVGYNNGAVGALGMAGGTKNISSYGGRSLILPATDTNVTTDSARNEDVTFSYELHGRTIGESNVFMSLFTAILKAAPHPKDERVLVFVVSARAFNAYLSLMERADPGPDGPFLKYEHVIRMLVQLPRWMISQGSQWTEAHMVVLIDDILVGAGSLVWQVREEMGTVEGGTVITS